METISQILARELNQKVEYVDNVISLLDEGNTLPFIARYRKELHGSMDDQLLRQLAGPAPVFAAIWKPKVGGKGIYENQGKLTEDLAAAVDRAITLAEVEDLYRPYKQKRRTRATAARERGLEPLALLLFGKGPAVTPEEAAADFVDLEKGVETLEDALQGASDIIAELISDDAEIRKELRDLYLRRGVLVSRRRTRSRRTVCTGFIMTLSVP